MTHHELKTLESLSDWQLEHGSQDVRGLPLVTRDHKIIGRIDDMLVDRDEERVAAVRLEDGSTYPVEALDVDDNVVVLDRERASALEAREEAGDGEEVRIPIAEEELVVGKRMVDKGGIRVRSRVVEQPVSETVSLRDEHIEIERRRAGRTAENPEALFREREVEMIERGEEAVVGKKIHVDEEMVLRKHSDQHEERVSDTVRRTEVDVDELHAEGAEHGHRR